MYMPIFLSRTSYRRRELIFLLRQNMRELKAITNLEPVNFTQSRNYLEAFNVKLDYFLIWGDKYTMQKTH